MRNSGQPTLIGDLALEALMRISLLPTCYHDLVRLGVVWKMLSGWLHLQAAWQLLMHPACPRVCYAAACNQTLKKHVTEDGLDEAGRRLIWATLATHPGQYLVQQMVGHDPMIQTQALIEKTMRKGPMTEERDCGWCCCLNYALGHRLDLTTLELATSEC